MDADTFTVWAMNYNADYYFKRLLSEGIKDSKLIGVLDYAINPANSSPFRLLMKKGQKLFRARIVQSDQYKGKIGIHLDEEGALHGFNRENSWEPPLGKPKAGRNNITGASYLYLAENPQTACAEVRPNFGDIVSVATFIPRRDLSLIRFSENVEIPVEFSKDLNISLPVFFTKLMNAFRTPYNSEDEYILTQTIADYVRKAGFDGIVYRSSQTNDHCYTIFNSHHSIIEYENSTLYLPVSSIHKYTEINSGEIVETELSIAKDDLPKFINNVKESIKKVLENKTID